MVHTISYSLISPRRLYIEHLPRGLRRLFPSPFFTVSLGDQNNIAQIRMARSRSWLTNKGLCLLHPNPMNRHPREKLCSFVYEMHSLDEFLAMDKNLYANLVRVFEKVVTRCHKSQVKVICFILETFKICGAESQMWLRK